MLQRQGLTFSPVDPWSAGEAELIPENVPMMAEIKPDRTRGDLKLYWAGLGLLHDNLDDDDRVRWPVKRKLHDTMMDALGFVHRIYRLDNSYRLETDSVALNNMSEEEFKVVLETMRAAVVKRWNYDPWDAWGKLKDEELAARNRLQLKGK